MDLSANIIIFGVLFIILIFGYYIFYANPYHIVDLFKIPLIVIYIFVIFCAIIFMELHLKNQKGQVGELFTDFTILFFKYFNFVFILVVLGIAAYYIYRWFIHTSVFLLNYSLWGTLGLLIIVLALLNQYSSTGTLDNPILQLAKDIIMYVPCLLTDLIESVKKDYNNTPTTTFILFIILVVYITFIYGIPEISHQIYKHDGITLITDPVYLNTNIISLSRTELNKKILDSLPFYDKMTQKLLLQLESITVNVNEPRKEKKDLSANYTDISANLTKILSDYQRIIDGSMNYLYDIDGSMNVQKPKKKMSDFPIFKESFTSIQDNPTSIQDGLTSFQENFTSVQNKDTELTNGWYNYLKAKEKEFINKLKNKNPQTQRDVDAIKFIWDNRPELLRAYISYLVLKHPELLNIVDKIQILYSATYATGQTFLSIPSLILGTSIHSETMYHYSISFWVYFNTLDNCMKKQTILSFGLKPSLYYTPHKDELTVEINNGDVIFKTNNVLFQRWNHFVFNYSYGIFDLFINNNLVSSQNLIPKMSPQEMFIVGSSKNDNVGGICNMKYYNIPLSADKINSIYKKFHKNSTPI